MKQSPPQDQRAAEEALIRRLLDCPRGTRIEYNDEGWDSRVYLVDSGEKVVKFPRTAAAREQYPHEVAALHLLASISGRHPVSVPVVERVAPGYAWFVCRGIVGTPLSQLVGTLGSATRSMIGTRLGRFLHALHRCELPGARRMEIEAEVENFREKYRLAEAALREHLSATEFQSTAGFYLEELPRELRALGGELRFGHGDLGPWNIVIPATGSVGVIDFGDAGYYEASRDFSGFGDPVLREAALGAYGADRALRARATLRSRAFPIADLPFYLGRDDPIGIEGCIRLVRSETLGITAENGSGHGRS